MAAKYCVQPFPILFWASSRVLLPCFTCAARSFSTMSFCLKSVTQKFLHVSFGENSWLSVCGRFLPVRLFRFQCPFLYR